MYVEPIVPCNVLYALEEWGNRRVYVVDKLPTTTEIKKWSTMVSGKFYKSRLHLVHTAGNHTEIWIKEKRIHNSTGELVEVADEYRRVRAAVQELTGYDDPGWTPGQIARSVNKWIAIKQRPVQNPKLILPAYNYYYAYPTYLTDGCLWDISSAYWTVAQTVPSPIVSFPAGTATRLVFWSISAAAMSRWRKMLQALQPYKSARLAMMGQYTSGWSDGPFNDVGYSHIRNGVWEKEPLRFGPLNPFGLLVVRCVYEICQQQRIEMDGCYAYVDCVVAGSDHSHPTYWRDLGIRYKVKAEGHVHIRSLDARAIGENKTIMYKQYEKAERHLLETFGTRPRLSNIDRAYHGRLIDPQLYYHPLFMGK